MSRNSNNPYTLIPRTYSFIIHSIPTFMFYLIRTIAYLLFWGCCVAAYGQAPCGGPPTQVPPAESYTEACIYCGFTEYDGTTAGYGPNGIPPGGFCSMIQNDQWIAFVAGKSSAMFTITPSNCSNGDGVQVALYSDINVAPLYCNAGGGWTRQYTNSNNGKHGSGPDLLPFD